MWSILFYDVSCWGEISLISKLWAVRLKVLFVKTFETSQQWEREHWANDSKRSDLANQSPLSLFLRSRLSQPSLYRAPRLHSKNAKCPFSGSLVEPAGACCYPTESDSQSVRAMLDLSRNYSNGIDKVRLSLSPCNCFIASHQSSLFIISNVEFLYKDVFCLPHNKDETGSQTLHSNWLVESNGVLVVEVEVVPIFKDKKEKRWGNYGGKETNRHEAFQTSARSGTASQSGLWLSPPLSVLESVPNN